MGVKLAGILGRFWENSAQILRQRILLAGAQKAIIVRAHYFGRTQTGRPSGQCLIYKFNSKAAAQLAELGEFSELAKLGRPSSQTTQSCQWLACEQPQLRRLGRQDSKTEQPPNRWPLGGRPSAGHLLLSLINRAGGRPVVFVAHSPTCGQCAAALEWPIDDDCINWPPTEAED